MQKTTMSAAAPGSSAAKSSKGSFQQTQDEVDEEWSDLDDWPEALQPEASQVGSDKRKRKSWWKDFQVWAKVIYVLAVVTIIILILLVVMWISPEKS